MKENRYVTLDGNEAVAHVAYRLNEVIAIYPITPSSNMAEWCDQWSVEKVPNIWGTIPSVTEMQSEGGAAGAVHGALQTGALSTTFTSAQGLLLMIPNMFKIAGELSPTVFHVAARSLAAQALSIFGDHSDVMSCRSTGWAMLSSASVQEAMDMAAIAHAAALGASLPFIHFFDGFRTSHEVSKIAVLSDDQLRELIDLDLVRKFRARALSPDNPVLRGTAQNPDVFFQARETVNGLYLACPAIVEKAMQHFAQVVGRQYKPYQYEGPADAERVIVMMGSGCETAHETVEYLNARGEKVGLLKVRMYRPFDAGMFIAALPASTRRIAVLDRCKEPGALGEPLYMDCVTALSESISSGQGHFRQMPLILAGRYGLSSKEFTPGMVKGVFDNLGESSPKNHFTVGINDDVTHTSIKFDSSWSIEPGDVVRALFYGLGADGTVGANKNSIKIIGENTDNYAQAYFVYDSKKSGAVTVSHLRFGPRPIRSTYLVANANFVACHQWSFVEKYDMLRSIADGGTFLINSPYGAEETWKHLPGSVQQQIISKKLKVYVIDAVKVAQETGMGGRINTTMQVCFFSVSGVLPKEQAIEEIKKSIKKTFGRKGEDVVQMNLRAVDGTLEKLFEMKVPSACSNDQKLRPPVPAEAPSFVREVLGRIISGDGDSLPVSALPKDGTFPTDTSRWERRNIALEIPVWDPEVCIQCGKCVMICPHATIRQKVYDEAVLAGAPATFKSTAAKDKTFAGRKFTIQIAPEDCTGCGLCVEVCPAKNKSEVRLKAINMAEQPPLREPEARNWDFFLSIPELDRSQIRVDLVRQQQYQRPLFEFSGACSGCGETPYLKLMSQLFGDRAVIANATGCSSIYGGNLPTTPWAQNAEGRGPAWSNSLFEDNAEFGMGFRLSINKQKAFAEELVRKLSGQIGDNLAQEILNCVQDNEAQIAGQRARVAELKKKLSAVSSVESRNLLAVADTLVKKSVWIVGGDGWAYDIGYGGLDHVLASGEDVNVLVLDTEVYSNTGGQASKSTPLGAVAKFAAGGKPVGKKDLGLLAMAYGTVYVARVAMGARDDQTLKAFLEAEAYKGPSLIIAYSHCIAHGIDMSTGTRNQKAAVDSGQWIMFRYNPEKRARGENPLQLDSKEPSMAVRDYLMMENRFKMLTKSSPAVAEELFSRAGEEVKQRFEFYKRLAVS